MRVLSARKLEEMLRIPRSDEGHAQKVCWAGKRVLEVFCFCEG